MTLSGQVNTNEGFFTWSNVCARAAKTGWGHKFGGQDASERDPLHLSLPTCSILCESGPGSVGELRSDASVISGLRRFSPSVLPIHSGESWLRSCHANRRPEAAQLACKGDAISAHTPLRRWISPGLMTSFTTDCGIRTRRFTSDALAGSRSRLRGKPAASLTRDRLLRRAQRQKGRQLASRWEEQGKSLFCTELHRCSRVAGRRPLPSRAHPLQDRQHATIGRGASAS